MPATLLLFEENADIRQLLSDLLEDTGYTVRHAHSLGEGERMVIEDDIDLFLADAGEVERGRAMRVFQDYCATIGRAIPMIIFTAHTIGREEVRDMGCADLISKPFDIAELLDRIEESLQTAA